MDLIIIIQATYFYNNWHANIVYYLFIKLDGTYKHIKDGLDNNLLNNTYFMVSYYIHLTRGMKIDNVLWTNDYLDFSLQIQVITLVKPIYIENKLFGN